MQATNYDVYHAIADPTRRAILDFLSWPATSQQSCVRISDEPSCDFKTSSGASIFEISKRKTAR